MNVFTCTGNLGNDAEVRHTQSSTVCGFSLAVRAGYGKNESTLWLRCSLWGKRAEGDLPSFLTKGTTVAVSGELSEREWEDRDGNTRKSLEMRINDLTLVGGKKQPPAEGKPAPKKDDFEDQDIPFN